MGLLVAVSVAALLGVAAAWAFVGRRQALDHARASAEEVEQERLVAFQRSEAAASAMKAAQRERDEALKRASDKEAELSRVQADAKRRIRTLQAQRDRAEQARRFDIGDDLELDEELRIWRGHGTTILCDHGRRGNIGDDDDSELSPSGGAGDGYLIVQFPLDDSDFPFQERAHQEGLLRDTVLQHTSHLKVGPRLRWDDDMEGWSFESTTYVQALSRGLPARIGDVVLRMVVRESDEECHPACQRAESLQTRCECTCGGRWHGAGEGAEAWNWVHLGWGKSVRPRYSETVMLLRADWWPDTKQDHTPSLDERETT
jgi:hypothetical protein